MKTEQELFICCIFNFYTSRVACSLITLGLLSRTQCALKVIKLLILFLFKKIVSSLFGQICLYTLCTSFFLIEKPKVLTLMKGHYKIWPVTNAGTDLSLSKKNIYLLLGGSVLVPLVVCSVASLVSDPHRKGSMFLHNVLNPSIFFFFVVFGCMYIVYIMYYISKSCKLII